MEGGRGKIKEGRRKMLMGEKKERISSGSSSLVPEFKYHM